jgi:hypothetical protein
MGVVRRNFYIKLTSFWPHNKKLPLTIRFRAQRRKKTIPSEQCLRFSILYIPLNDSLIVVFFLGIILNSKIIYMLSIHFQILVESFDDHSCNSWSFESMMFITFFFQAFSINRELCTSHNTIMFLANEYVHYCSWYGTSNGSLIWSMNTS